MSWGTELWDQFENVCTHTQKGIDFCEKFSHFLKERCSIENEYAAKLKKLVKSYSPKKKEDDGFSTSRGFDAVVKELYDLAGQHESIAETLQNNVCKDLLELVHNMKQEKKKLLQDASKQESALQNQLSQLDKAKKAYEKAFREAERAQEAFKRGDQDTNLSRAEVDKLKQALTFRQQISDDSKREYASEVEKTRCTQTEHFQTAMPHIFNQFQELDERRVKKFQECIKNSADYEKTTLPIITKCIEGMADAANLVDIQKDSQAVIDKYKSGFSPVLDVVFEDLSNPVKNSSPASGKLTLSTKTKKRAGLRGIFGGGQKNEEPKEDFSHLPPSQQKKQLLAKIESIRGRIAKETSQRDGMVKMLDVYQSNPKLGDVALLTKQLEENGQILDSLRQELNKYETYLSEADNRLQESGHTPNASPLLGQQKHPDRHSNTSQGNNGASDSRQTLRLSTHEQPPPPPAAENDFSDDEFTDVGTCTALYAYEGEGSLSMSIGQQFTIVDRDQGDGWTQVRASDGAIGFVPTSYVKIND